MLAAARSAFGRLDMLINNAAASVTADFVAQNAEQIRRQIEVNLVAPILLVHEALPLFPVGGNPRWGIFNWHFWGVLIRY